MMVMSPYRNRSALRQADEFFGRRQELAEIYSSIEGGHFVSLVGERRVGKTSILNALRFPEYHRAFDIGPHVCFAFVNAQYCAGRDEECFLKLLLDQIARTAGTTIRGGTRDVLRDVAQELHSRSVKLVVLLDEVDVLVNNPAVPPDFFSYLRAWTEEFQVPFVIASKEGSVDRLVETQGAGSSFWNVYKSVYVGPMTPDEANELIRVPAARCDVEFSDIEVNHILALGGYQPFFLQIACDQMFNAKTKGTAIDFAEVALAFRHEADLHLRYLVEHIPESERMALTSYVTTEAAPEGRLQSELIRKGILVTTEGKLRPFSTALIDVVSDSTPRSSTLFTKAANVLFR
jgi:hypothetical protein